MDLGARGALLATLNLCNTTTSQCTATVRGTVMQPVFFSVNSHTLTITKGASGRVTSDPAGIDCGTVCSSSYPDGTVVTLSAAADANWRFMGWSGACSGTAEYKVTLAAASTATATFVIAR